MIIRDETKYKMSDSNMKSTFGAMPQCDLDTDIAIYM